jgi:hypothetical protein
VVAARRSDRVGKGIPTAPRDALVANSVDERGRGLVFGFHRAADTAGAMFGLLIARHCLGGEKGANVFRTIV